MVFRYKSRHRKHRLERTVIRIQSLYMDSKELFYWFNKIFVQIYVCPSVKSHRYYYASQFVMEHPKVKNLALHFPFKKYHRSMYTVDLIEYIFTQIINGANFLPVAESIAAMHLSRYVKDTGDKNVAKFNSNTIYSYPSPHGIEAIFLDIFNNLRDEFCGTLALPSKSISVDHTFQVGKPIGGHREQDNKFIKSYKKLFLETLPNYSTLQDEIESVLNEVKFKLNNNPISYIYTDTCCGFKKVYEQFFPGVPIKLDLFHATQRITKTLPDKKSPEAIDFSRSFGLVFRNSFDTGDTKNQITEDPATITRNIDGFMKLFIKELPVNKRNDLLLDIENMKKHVEKGRVSGIPPGGGTENNERLQRYLN